MGTKADPMLFGNSVCEKIGSPCTVGMRTNAGFTLDHVMFNSDLATMTANTPFQVGCRRCLSVPSCSQRLALTINRCAPSVTILKKPMEHRGGYGGVS